MLIKVVITLLVLSSGPPCLSLADAQPVSNSDDSLIPADNPTTSVQVTRVGRDIATIRFDGLNATVAVPANDAPSPTTMSLTGTVNQQSDGESIETLSLRFDRDVTFSGYPSFRLEAPSGTALDGLFQLRFFDGVGSVALRQIDPDPKTRRLTFEGGFFTPFRASANETYYAILFARPPAVREVTSLTNPQALVLAITSGVATALDLPGATVGSGSMTVAGLDKPPAGFPTVARQDEIAMPYYISIALRSTLRFKGKLTATLLVPLTRAFYASRYTLALCTRNVGWRIVAERSSQRQGDVLRFTLESSDLMDMRSAGQYLLALYASQPTHSGVDRISRAHVVVLGDSLSNLTILPQNPIGCTSGAGPMRCQYTEDPALSYPGVIAQLTGADVVNFWEHGETTVDLHDDKLPPWANESWISTFPRVIHHDTDVVILEAGIADLHGNGCNDLSVTNRPIAVADAIHAQAPNAKIIYIGTRACSGIGPNYDAVRDGWNNVERNLAARDGAFVDLLKIWPVIYSAQFPDGLHAGPETNREIGSVVTKVLRSVLEH